MFGLLRVYFVFYSYHFGTSRMQCIFNCWYERNLLVMVLRMKKTLRLTDSSVWLYPCQTAQAQHQHLSQSIVNTPLHLSHPRCLWWPLLVVPNVYVERCSTQTAVDWTISNYSILNTLMFHTRRVLLFAAWPDPWNPLSIMNSMLWKSTSKTWMHFPTSNTLQTSQPKCHIHHQLLGDGRKPAPALVLHCAFNTPRYADATLTVALTHSNKIIPTTHLRCVKSTNISNVESRWLA